VTLDQLKQAKQLRVADRRNAVPPSGVEGGCERRCSADPGTKRSASGARGRKRQYRTEAGLFKQMIDSEKPLYLDFRDAYALAQKLAG
jgi:methylene-tetrahydromethanopterin dehydrogenase